MVILSDYFVRGYFILQPTYFLYAVNLWWEELSGNVSNVSTFNLWRTADTLTISSAWLSSHGLRTKSIINFFRNYCIQSQRKRRKINVTSSITTGQWYLRTLFDYIIATLVNHGLHKSNSALYERICITFFFYDFYFNLKINHKYNFWVFRTWIFFEIIFQFDSIWTSIWIF